MSNHVANLKACLEAGDPGSIMLQDLEYVIKEYEYADEQCGKQAEEITALKAAMAVQSTTIETATATINELRDAAQANELVARQNAALQEKVSELTIQKTRAEAACDTLRRSVGERDETIADLRYRLEELGGE